MGWNILVSACLLGVNCRYNGIEKSNPEVRKLLERKDIHLIPVCPEQLGGLPTPRVPAEISPEGSVITKDGRDVTTAYRRGAAEALKLAELYACPAAILKERSPSCGCKEVYDGTFTGTLTKGNGVAADCLMKNNIKIFGETKLAELPEWLVSRRIPPSCI